MDMHNKTPRPVSHGYKKVNGRDVELIQGHDMFMGEVRRFWRADYQGITIATGCQTKAECISEVRHYFSRMNQ